MAHTTTLPNRRAARAQHLSRIEATVLCVLAVALVLAAATSAGTSTRGIDRASVRVREGDTPWSLARSHPVAGLTTAETASLIIEMNELDGSYLLAGDSVLVPAQGINGTLAMR